MPQQLDYAALAKQLGGQPMAAQPGAGASPEPDYAALAGELGGSPLDQGTAARPSIPFAVSHRRTPPPQTTGRFLSEATQSVNPVTLYQGVKQTVSDPIGVARSVPAAHGERLTEMVDAYKRGDYLEALRHMGEYALPIATAVGGGVAGLPAGPAGAVAGAMGGYGLGVGMAGRLDQAADNFLAGDVAGGLGASVDTALMGGLGARGMAAPQPSVVRTTTKPKGVAASARRVVERVVPKNLTPEDQAAVQFARERGIPLDAGTATGSQLLKNQQKAVGSYGPAESFRASQTDALARVGRDLAADAGPNPVTRVGAGEGVRRAVENRVTRFHRLANDAYTRLRQAERVLPEEPVQVRPEKPKAAGHVTPEQSFLLRWLANDLQEFQFQPGGTTLGTRRRAYESVDPVEAEALMRNPRVAGTPVQEMMHAIGIKGSRPELAIKLDRFLAGQLKDPRFNKLADVLNEAWDGERFDFDLVSDDALANLGARRRDLKSPMGLPDYSEAGAGTFFPDRAVPQAPKAGSETLMRGAFDIRPHKAALQSLADELSAEREITGNLMGSKGRAAVALDALLKGPDFAPVSTVDAALGEIKGLTRGASMSSLRNRGQGVASKIVGEIETGLQSRIQALGGDMAGSLYAGREATKAKYRAADVLKSLPQEPARVYGALTARGDTGIKRLRAVAAEVPEELPNLARATLEGLIEDASRSGTPFGNSERMYANWQKLGAETRARLFPGDGQIKALNDYFLLAKRIGENPNPSGTAAVSMASLNPLRTIPRWALANILYAPDGAAALNKVQILLKSPSKAARAAALTQLARAAQSAGVPFEAIPALAERDPQAPGPPAPAARR